MSDTKISNLTELTAPVAEDELVIVDKSDTSMADSGTTKKVQAIEILQDLTHNATAKTTPVDADEIGLIDSAASNVLKKLTWANLKAVLLAYFQGVIPTLNKDWDGWNLADETWTYASATTFTVPTDLTAKYTKGTKIKCTNSTVKYFYVVSSNYAAPNTTVTVTGETDLANSAITAPYYSYADCPRGFKRGQDWYKARAYSSGSQSLANYTITAITLDTEDFDTNGNFASNQYTAPISGYYSLSSSLTFESNSTGYRRADIDVSDTAKVTQIAQAVSTTITITGTSDTTYLAKGAVVKLKGRQTSGGALNVLTAQNGTYLSIQFIGV